MVIHSEEYLPNSETPEEAQDWLSIVRTPYPTQNLQRNTGLGIHSEDTLPNSKSPEEAQDCLSIVRTPYPTQNLQRKHRTVYPS